VRGGNTTFWKRFAQLNGPFLARELRRLAEQVEHLAPGPVHYIQPPLFTLKGQFYMSEITVADNETGLSASITPLDSEQQPTTLDTPPTWTSSDTNVVTVNAADDGLSATFDVGSPGDAIVTVDTGVDDGTGNDTTIRGVGTVHVTPGGVATLDLEFSQGDTPPPTP
jgi:hypothetical protein